MKKVEIRYTESYKRLVVSMLAEGSLKSINLARKVLDIKGSSTITRWVRKYRPEILPMIKVRTEDEIKNLHPELYKKAKGNLNE